MDYSVSATFFVLRTFATSVKWMTRAVRQRLQKFYRRGKHSNVLTIIYVTVNFWTLNSN